MTTLEERSILGIAEAIAPGWEAQRPRVEAISTPVREWMVREVAPQHGDTVLELAAGVGDTGFEAAKLVGDTGRLICSDLSPAMLGAARRRGDELGLRGVEYRVLDAQRIELDDDSVDRVLCRFGYMLMPDAAAALRETRRVLRTGGRLSLAVWGPPERNPFVTILGRLLVERGHMATPGPSVPTPFALGDPEGLRRLLRDAGFESIRVAEVEVSFPFRGLDDYLDFVADTSGAVGLAVRALPPDERAAIQADVEGAFAPFAAGGGAYRLPGLALVAAAG